MGFPFRPSGCQIVLDKQAQTIVLDNVKSQIANRWPQIVAELKSVRRSEPGDVPQRIRARALPTSFVRAAARGRASVVRPNLPTRHGSDRETKLLRRGRAFSHVDDSERASHYLDLLRDDTPGIRRAHGGQSNVLPACSCSLSGPMVAASSQSAQGLEVSAVKLQQEMRSAASWISVRGRPP